MAALEGRTLNHYELRRLVGKGGMADVYEALDLTNQRVVAVKVFKREDEEMLQRFIREAKLMRSLNNPHLVPIFDSGTRDVDGMTVYYIVMPFLAGGTLRAHIRSGGGLPLDEVCRDLKDIASALDYIHTQGIIHRDIKASNVLLNSEGRCYLSDFGIARISTEATQLTSTGNVLGTVDYVAPELFEVNHRADAMSDLYSLGILLYEMVTGQLPFSAENQIALVSMHMNKRPPLPRTIAPQVPPQVERVMMRVLEKRPEQRYASATELANAFCRAVAVGNQSGATNVGTGQSQPPLVLPATDAVRGPAAYPQYNAPSVPVQGYNSAAGNAPFAPASGSSYAQKPAASPYTQPRRTSSGPVPPRRPRRSRPNPTRRRGIIVAVLALLTLLILLVPSIIYVANHPSNNSKTNGNTTPTISSSPSTVASPTHAPTPTPNLTATAQAIAAATATAQVHATQTAVARATATAAAQASATAGVIQTATAGTPKYQDALNNASNAQTKTASWDGLDGGNSNCTFQADGYHVTEGTSLHGCRESAYNYANGTVSVDMVLVKGLSGGLFFRVNTVLLNAYSGYLFEIDSNSRYRIRGSDNFSLNTNTNTLQDWTPSSAIKGGYNVKNILQVIMSGSTLLFYANGVFLTQATDGAYTSGNVALGAFAAGGNTEVIYSNIKIYPHS